MSEKADTGFKYVSLLLREFSFFDIKAAFFAAVPLEKSKISGNKIEIYYWVSLQLFKRNVKNNFIQISVSNFNSIKISPCSFTTFQVYTYLLTKMIYQNIFSAGRSLVVHRKKSYQKYPITASCICT